MEQTLSSVDFTQPLPSSSSSPPAPKLLLVLRKFEMLTHRSLPEGLGMVASFVPLFSSSRAWQTPSSQVGGEASPSRSFSLPAYPDSDPLLVPQPGVGGD